MNDERIDAFNQSEGNMNDYECPKCKNRGYFMTTNSEGYDFLKECECMKIRRLNKLVKNCGLGDSLDRYKLENFKHEQEWQNNIYQSAIRFLNSDANALYIGGQVGSGKSHICTGIVRELVYKGYDCYYVVWSDIVTQLKQNIMERAEEYDSKLNRMKEAEVLYIDDFFKNEPTRADIDNAFKIINYRYNMCRNNSNSRMKTIISSEKTLKDLVLIDEAIASRISEMAQGKFLLAVGKDPKKNMRFKQK